MKLERNIEEGKVTLKYKLKDLCNDGNPEKEFSKTIEGFKKAQLKEYKSQEVYEASVAGKLFTVDPNKLSELRQALAQQQNPVALKNGKVLTKNNKGKTIPGISVNNKAISHGKNSTINVAIKKGNYRGVNIVKENGNYVAK